jgi:hypothetical protein
MRLIAMKRCRVMVEPPEKWPVICFLLRSPNGGHDPSDQDNAEDEKDVPDNFVVETRFCHASFAGSSRAAALIWIMPFRHPSKWPFSQRHQRFMEASYNGLSTVIEAGEVPMRFGRNTPPCATNCRSRRSDTRLH